MQGSIELSVNVLTMGYWPPYTPMEVILPPEVRNAHARSSVASYVVNLYFVLSTNSLACLTATPIHTYRRPPQISAIRLIAKLDFKSYLASCPELPETSA